MTLIRIYKKHCDKWWALPLFLPSLLLPILRQADTFAYIEGGTVILYYLPLALMMSFMLFYGWKVLPGMVIALWLHFYDRIPAAEVVIAIGHFIIPVIISWIGYRLSVPRRHMVSYGNDKLMLRRMFWQVFCLSTLFMILLECLFSLGVYSNFRDLAGSNPFNIRTLISYQAMLVGSITGIPLCYALIRTIRNPFYLRSFISQLRAQFDPKIKLREVILWFMLLMVLLAMLLLPANENSTLFSTNYTLSLVLPVALWGSMRFGHRFMSMLWTPVLIVIISFHPSYLHWSPVYSRQMAITSSSYLVFSFIVVYMAMLCTHQRQVNERSRRQALLDPLLHMPNLRALNRALASAPWSILCLLRIPDLEPLGRNYGVMFRIQYKQRLAEWLKPLLQDSECVYQLSGYDLAIRLNTESHVSRIGELDEHIKQFRFLWDDVPLQPPVAMSYCYVRSPVSHLYLLLGELSTIADLSLVTHHPESLQRRGANHLQQALKGKICLMNRLQQALDNDRFRLLSQPVEGIRGDSYYEVLLQMIDEEGKVMSADIFMPVAHEFGLSSHIDMWMIEHALIEMARLRGARPGLRLAVPLSSASVCRARLSQQVQALLEQYGIEPWQLIFRVKDTRQLEISHVNQTMVQLQQLGCRVAVEAFGAGCASYARLKDVHADILKIDGDFIRNMVVNSIDYQVVVSIGLLARMQNMMVAAGGVDSNEIRSAVSALGIDYWQGNAIGKAVPLSSSV